MSEIDPKGLVERLIAAIRLGEATGSRGRAASNIYNLADEAASLIQSQAAEIERLTRETDELRKEAGELVVAQYAIAAVETERDKLRAGLNAIVNLQSGITRAAIREAAADILRRAGGATWSTQDQSPFLARAEAAEADLARAREALEAFAALVPAAFDDGYESGDYVNLRSRFGDVAYLRVRDFRVARTALHPNTSGEAE